MRHGIDERFLLLIPADFADQEDGIQNHTADQHRSQNDAQEQQDIAAPAQENPADVDQDDNGNQARAEGDEKSDRLPAAGNYHVSSLREECGSAPLPGYAASRAAAASRRLATRTAFAIPRSFIPLIRIQEASNSYHASPWRAEAGCA